MLWVKMKYISLRLIVFSHSLNFQIKPFLFVLVILFRYIIGWNVFISLLWLLLAVQNWFVSCNKFECISMWEYYMFCFCKIYIIHIAVPFHDVRACFYHIIPSLCFETGNKKKDCNVIVMPHVYLTRQRDKKVWGKHLKKITELYYNTNVSCKYT